MKAIFLFPPPIGTTNGEKDSTRKRSFHADGGYERGAWKLLKMLCNIIRPLAKIPFTRKNRSAIS